METAVHRHGYAWLRAWARYDEIFIQAPQTWGGFGPTQLELNESLLHELTHCMMYQLAANRWNWTEVAIPLWFREGMASFVAGQKYRRASLGELAGFYATHPGTNPLTAAESLYRDRSDIVYAAAHHAFEFLVQRHGGEPAVRALLLRLRSGVRFSTAFERKMGVSLEAFQTEFEQHLSVTTAPPS